MALIVSSVNPMSDGMSELGFRMAQDKPVVLLKAAGTGPLFDVDNMLRVFEYNSNLWQTTVEKDMPNLCEFIKVPGRTEHLKNRICEYYKEKATHSRRPVDSLFEQLS